MSNEPFLTKTIRGFYKKMPLYSPLPRKNNFYIGTDVQHSGQKVVKVKLTKTGVLICSRILGRKFKHEYIQ